MPPEPPVLVSSEMLGAADGEPNPALVMDAGRVRHLAHWPLDGPAPGQVELRPAVVGVCGTDFKILRGQKACVDGPIGHEAVAVVAATGDGVENLKRGDWVVVSPHFEVEGADGRPQARNIGYTEGSGLMLRRQVLARRRVLATGLPATAPRAVLEALTQCDGLACCLRAQSTLELPAGALAVVLGPGTMGVLHALLLRRAGLRVALVGRRQESLGRARRSGAAHRYLLRDEATGALAGTAALAVVCNSDPDSYLQALDLLADGGQLCAYSSLYGGQRRVRRHGIDLDVAAFHEATRPSGEIALGDKRIRVSGGVGYRPRDFDAARRILASGDLDLSPFVADRLALTGDLVDRLWDRRRLGGKILVYPQPRRGTPGALPEGRP